MGDRAQIAIKQSGGKSKLYLYAHWAGSDIFPSIQKSLDRARDRWGDPEYLARVVFQDLIGNDDKTTGFGISTQRHSDIEHLVPVLDCNSQMVEFEPANYGPGSCPAPIGFADFCALPAEQFQRW